MARRRRRQKEDQTKQLQAKSSPAFFLMMWLGIPMILMIGYAFYLTQK